MSLARPAARPCGWRRIGAGQSGPLEHQGVFRPACRVKPRKTAGASVLCRYPLQLCPRRTTQRRTGHVQPNRNVRRLARQAHGLAAQQHALLRPLLERGKGRGAAARPHAPHLRAARGSCVGKLRRGLHASNAARPRAPHLRAARGDVCVQACSGLPHFQAVPRCTAWLAAAPSATW